MMATDGKEWIPAPKGFDGAKFAERYGLDEADLEIITFNGDAFVKVSTDVAAKIGEAPVFEKLPPVEPTPRIDYAMRLVSILMPKASEEEQAELLDALLKFAGDRPADMRVKPDRRDAGSAEVVRQARPRVRKRKAVSIELIAGQPVKFGEPVL